MEIQRAVEAEIAAAEEKAAAEIAAVEEKAAAEIAKAAEEQMEIQRAVEAEIAAAEVEAAAEIAAAEVEATAEIAKALEEQMEFRTYRVGTDIQPGIYAGKSGAGLFGFCYWERLSGASGDFSDVIANSTAVGQFYVDILSTDKYFKVDCDIVPIDKWPRPAELLSSIEPGTYLVGRDIAAGTYRGETGSGVLDSCLWERLSGLSGGVWRCYWD